MVRTLLVFLLFFPVFSSLRANPTGASVAAGTASITSAGSTLSIVNSNGAIINWQSFSIGSGEVTSFLQPSAASAVLNRVVGGNISMIYGALQSNGQVFLVNPSGVVIGAGGMINTAGFVASTLDVSDSSFAQYANGGGNLTFMGASTAKVQNLGTINAAGGNVFLIGQQVENDGTINAPQGTAGLYASSQVYLTTGQPDAGSVLVTASNLSGGALPTGVSNTGLIQAVQAELKATGNMYALAVNNAGTVHATGVSTHDGIIHLGATGGVIQNTGTLAARNADGSGGTVKVDAGSGGTVYASGLIDVSSTTAGAKGGTAQLTGDNVALYDGGIIAASGPGGGGTVLLGGDSRGTNPDVYDAQNVFLSSDATIRADATDSGNGGKVVLWSNGTTQFYGSISARGGPNGGNGGSIETSGEQTLIAAGSALTSAPHGAGGNWLLDPTGDLTIEDAVGSGTIPVTGTVTFAAPTGSTAGANYILNSSLETALAGNGTVTVTSTDNIFWNGNFTLSSAPVGGSTLALQAGGSIFLGYNEDPTLTTLELDSLTVSGLNIHNTSGKSLTLDFESANAIAANQVNVNASTGDNSAVTLNFLSGDGAPGDPGTIYITTSMIYTLGGNVLISGGTSDPVAGANGGVAPSAAGYTPTYYAQGSPSGADNPDELYDGVLIAGSTILASSSTGAAISIYGQSASESGAVGVRLVDSLVGVESQGTGGTLIVFGKSTGTDANSFGVSLEAGSGLWVDGQGPGAIGNVTAGTGKLYLTAVGGSSSLGLNVQTSLLSTDAASDTGNYSLGTFSSGDSGLILTTGAGAIVTTDSIGFNNLNGTDIFDGDTEATSGEDVLVVAVMGALNTQTPSYLSGSSYLGQADAHSSLTVQPYTLSTTIGIGGAATGETLLPSEHNDAFASTFYGRPDGTGAVTVTPSGSGDGINDTNQSITVYGGSIDLTSDLSITGTGDTVTLVANGGSITLAVGATLSSDSGTNSVIFTLANSNADSAINLGGTVSLTGSAIFNANAGTISDTGSFTVGGFVLNSGTWSQNGATLPDFSATDFTLNGGTFLRALGGDGSAGTPYQITDVYGLQGIGSPSGSLLADNFILANEIDASGTAMWNSGAGFVPIGNPTAPYIGTFNGNGTTIDGLTIFLPAADNVGLFGQVGETTFGATGLIENVGLANVSITGDESVGGLAGVNSFSAVKYSYVTGTVAGNSETGGLIGSNTGDFNGDATVEYSYSTATVNGGNSTGGLVGLGFDDTIQYSYATGAVSGSGSVGGLLGSGDYTTTDHSYALGNVTGTGNGVGGLVGYSGSATIQYSYSTGQVSGGSAVGGFVGHLDFESGGSLTANYWNTTTSGTTVGVGDSTSDQVTGLTTAQMMDVSNYDVSWNFALPTGNNGTLVQGIWGINAAINGGLPYFQWQHPYLVVTATDQSVVYGNSISPASLGTTYTVAGLTGTDTIGSVLSDGAPSLSLGSSNVDVGTTNPIDMTVNINEGENYLLLVTNATESFTPAPLSVALQGTVSKVYDGTTTATLLPGNYILDGLVGNDGNYVSASSTAATYSGSDAGTGLVVTATGVSLSSGNSTKLGDYILTSTTASGNIGTITGGPTTSSTTSGTTSSDSIVPPVVAAQVLPIVIAKVDNSTTQAISPAVLVSTGTTSGANGGTDATVGTGSNSDPDTGAGTDTAGGGGKKSATLAVQAVSETVGGSGTPAHESVATQGAAGSIGGGGIHVNIPPPPEVTANFNKVLGPVVLNKLKAALGAP